MNSDRVNIRLPYGDSFLEAKVPADNLVAVLERRPAVPLENEAAAVRESLRAPVNRPPLADCLRPNNKVAVIVTDNTRACPDDRLLPVILGEVESKVPRRNITVVIALGLHEPLDRDAIARKVGKNIAGNYRVLNHDVNDTIGIGETSRGNPVEIFREVAAADYIISTGFIEPHFFAGFSGGRKSIAPGVSSRRAVCCNHVCKMLDHENARSGVLSGNPVHEDMVEQALLAGLDFIVNVLLDKDNRITHVVAGDPVLAHETGCGLEKELASVPLDREADVTIVTNGGAPLDSDFYQACKGIDTAGKITRKGGIIIMVSRCHSGRGPEDFYRLHAVCRSPAEVLEKIRCNESLGVQWQNQMLARTQLDHQVMLVSGLRPDVLEGMMVRPVISVGEGVEQALSLLGGDARIAVIPEGPRVLPFISGHSIT
jgi:nickel-dependent lactate racemase